MPDFRKIGILGLSVWASMQLEAQTDQGLVQVDVTSVLNGRSVSTFTNGKIVSWSTGFDGKYSGEATLAVAQALGNTNPKALPNDGFFPANNRHPDVQLHFSNTDGVSNQSRYVTGAASFGFDVPVASYSILHVFALSANGPSMIDVDLVYSNGTVRKSFEVPDWYNYVTDADRYVLADDLDKWDMSNARTEQGHHYIFGFDLRPDAGRVLTRIVINKQNAGALTFWGATGVRTGPVKKRSSNLALNKPVSVSSTEANLGNIASNATDGDASTRWSSLYTDPQWIQIDLGKTYLIDTLVIRWEAAYASAYKIETSVDGTIWLPARNVASGDGGVDEMVDLNATCRYIKLTGTQRATTFGYSLYELEAYGNEVVTNYNDVSIDLPMVYPNPFQDRIQLDLPANTEVELMDKNGRLLYKGAEASIQTGALSKGLYLLKIKQVGGTQMIKISKN